LEGTFREETVYAVVFWWEKQMADNNTLAAFLPVLLWKILSIITVNNLFFV